MTYFKEEEKNVLIHKNKKSKTMFLIFLSVFILLSILFVIFRNYIGNTLSLIILIVLSSLFFSYMLCFLQIYLKNRRVISLYEKGKNSNYNIEGQIKDILPINTIDQLPFKVILLNTSSGDRKLFLYDDLNIQYNIGENKNFLVCGNIIIGENNHEETIN